MGICTKTDLVEESTHLYGAKGLGDVYCFDGYNHKLYKSVEGSIKETYASNLGKWNNGQTMTVILDCEKWQVIFWRDNTRLGNPIKISPNKTYYPVMNCCTSIKNKFQVIVR